MAVQPRGTSPELAQELYQISAALESQRRNKSKGAQGAGPTSDFYKGELDAQRQSKVFRLSPGSEKGYAGL